METINLTEETRLKLEQDVLDLLKDGKLTLEQVSRHCRCSLSFVCGIRRKHSLPNRPRGRRQPEVK
jgi:hypothetical protein